MEDFYKKLRDNLNERTEPTPKNRHWEHMQELLDQEEKTPVAGYWQWLAAAAILLLLGSNFWWWQQIDTTKTVETVTTIDTVFHTKVVYQTDTIFKEKIIIQRIDNQQLATTSLSDYFYKNIVQSTQLASLERSFIHTPPATILNTNKEKSLLFNPAFVTTPDSLTANNNSPLLLSDLAYLEALSPAAVQYPKVEKLSDFLLDIPIVKLKKDLGTYLYAARPKALVIGVNGGWSKPFNKQIHDQSDQVIGAELQTVLSNGLRIWTSFDYTNNRFDTNEMNENIGVPPLSPPSNNYVFEKAKVKQSLYQYGLGLQYNFRANKTLQPIVGVGYGTLKRNDSEVFYEFEDEQNDLELIFEQEIDGGSILRDYLLLRTGIAYQFNDHWKLQLLANYRQQMTESQTPFAQILELKGGVYYQF